MAVFIRFERFEHLNGLNGSEATTKGARYGES